jgi:mono/diheme cytochrome c family protein
MTKSYLVSAFSRTVLVLAVLAVVVQPFRPAVAGTTPADSPTFARDVAPIVYDYHCAVCHRPGQAAPFPLLA